MSGGGTSLGVINAFRVRGEVFVQSLLKVLHWAHAVKGVRPDVAQLRLCLPFATVVRIVQKRVLPLKKGTAILEVDISDIPDPVIAPLRAYLNETTDFDPAHPADTQHSGVPELHHGFVIQSLRKDLGSYLL